MFQNEQLIIFQLEFASLQLELELAICIFQLIIIIALAQKLIN